MLFHPTRRAFCGGALALGCGLLARPSLAADQTLSAADLQEDVRILRRAYGALHPGLFRYNSPATMSARFDALAAALSKPRTLGAAQVAFQRTVAAVRCGHSFLNPANAQGAGQGLIDRGRTRLPFRFAWSGDQMVLLEDCPADPTLRRGATISTLGGLPCGELRRELMALASADGSNDGKRRRLTELRGEERWELADTYLPLLHPGVFDRGRIGLTVQGPEGGRSRAVEVALLTREERVAAQDQRIWAGAGNTPVWRTEHLEDGSGYLRMRTWALYDSKWDWREALHADLDRLIEARAPGLIVDLRGNAGGLDCGDLILQRMSRRPVGGVGYHRLVRYRRTPDDLNRYLETWDRSFRDWGADAIGPDASGFYRLTRYDEDPVEAAPARPRFAGRLVVLVDAANSSATFQFAAAVKRSGLGRLVGETTGGNQRGINGGAFFFLRLPGSGLEIDLPLIGYYPDTPQPDAGIAPDVPVQITAADIAAGRDPALQIAKGMLRA